MQVGTHSLYEERVHGFCRGHNALALGYVLQGVANLCTIHKCSDENQGSELLDMMKIAKDKLQFVRGVLTADAGPWLFFGEPLC